MCSKNRRRIMNARNLRLTQSSPSIRMALDKYLIEISSNKKSYEQEKSLIKTWSATHIYDKPIATVKPNDLVRIRDAWLQNLNPATVARRFALISNLYTVAVKDWMWSYIKENPVQLIRKPIAKPIIMFINKTLPKINLALP